MTCFDNYAVFYAPQNVVCSLSCQGTLLAYMMPAVTSTHRAFLQSCQLLNMFSFLLCFGENK